MKKRTLIILAALALPLLAAAGYFMNQTAANPDGVQAGMFEWDEPALKDPGAAIEMARTFGISRWYQALPQEIDAAETAAFVEALGAEGISVYALVGETEWGFEEDGASLIAWLKKVADYNAQAAASGRFIGVMLDVEPYIRTKWKEEPEKWAPVYLSGSKRAYQYARKRGLATIACLPRHYDDKGLGEMLEGLIADACDEVAIMNYGCGDEAQAIATEAQLARRYDKPLHCILEFQRVGKHGLTEDETYYNKGLAAADAAWRQVEAANPGQTVIRDYHWTNPLRDILSRDGEGEAE